MPNLFWLSMLSKEKGDDYIQDGLIYRGIGTSADIGAISLPNGEFTIEIVNELLSLPESSTAYVQQFYLRNTNPTDTTNTIGNLRKDGGILYYTQSDNWYIGSKPQGYNVIGDKRTSSFVFDSDNLKSFYYNADLIAQKQASETFSRTDYNNVLARTIDFNVFEVRIYDRALSAEEIAHNYQIDKERYLI